MRFPYLTADPSQSELDSLPRLPLTLRYGPQQITELGLVDSGATGNVLPYSVGVQLGAVWDGHKATIRLAGNLGNFAAMPLVVTAARNGLRRSRMATVGQRLFSHGVRRDDP